MADTRDGELTVLKLGGAQARGGRLGAWLDAVSAQAGRIVLVPGGGPFANVVRETQSQIGFDDVAAHEMAMVAMSQFGRALVSLRPGFALVDSLDAIRAALARGVTPVWSPERMALAAGLAPSWDLTSDSLAAWLAGLIGARRLVLVKHGAAPARADDLAARGIVDPLFARYLESAGARGYLADPDDFAGLDGGAFAEIRA